MTTVTCQRNKKCGKFSTPALGTTKQLSEQRVGLNAEYIFYGPKKNVERQTEASGSGRSQPSSLPTKG